MDEENDSHANAEIFSRRPSRSFVSSNSFELMASAQYFISPRRPHLSSRTSNTNHRQDDDQDVVSQSGSQSIYIFPSNPQVADTDLPISSSALGTNISIPISLFDSRASSRDRQPQISGQTSPSPLEGDDIELWDWSESMTEESADVDDDDKLSFSEPQWAMVVRRQHQHRRALTPTSSRTRSRYQSSSSQPDFLLPSKNADQHGNPHPRLHIPLLSFFMSLVSADEATLHLITHSSSQSTLFPGNAPLPYSHLSTDDPPHGVIKLLAHRGESHTLKDGLDIAFDPSYTSSNPFSLPGLHLVWGLVNNVVLSGGKALREVLLY